MKKEVIFNPDLHFEHETWSRELDFWKDEIETFQNRLNELVMKHTDKDMYASIEKFQNQFDIQEEALNKIRNHILMHETNMSDHYQRDEDSMNRDMVKKHVVLRDHMEIQRGIMGDMKKSLFEFLTKYV